MNLLSFSLAERLTYLGTLRRSCNEIYLGFYCGRYLFWEKWLLFCFLKGDFDFWLDFLCGLCYNKEKKQWVSFMKRKLRFVLMFLIVLGLSALFVACGSGNVSSSDDTGTDTEVVAPAPKGISLSSLAEYTVVRSRSADLTQKASVTELKRNLKEILGFELNICGDGEASAASEILVGTTNRPESEAFMNSLRYHDYGYAVVGDKVVIGGHSQEALDSAIVAFCDALTAAVSEKKEILEEGEYLTRGEYPKEDMTIFGLSTKDLTLVYPMADKDYAENLAKVISDRSGYLVTAVSSRATLPAQGNLLIFGVSGIRGLTADEAVHPSDICVKSSENTVLLAGGEFGYEQLCNSLLANVMAGDGGAIPLPVTASDGASLRVVSYNVWVSSRTPERIAAVVESIRWMNPDVVGLQEADAKWVADLTAALPSYGAVGVGRDGKNDEGAYILYRKDRVSLVKTNTLWLSDTPNVPSKFTESRLNRTCTYAMLKRKTDGKVFVFFNTHLDHTSDVARTGQIGVMLKEMEAFREYPILVTGDFNSTSSSEVYASIRNAGYGDSRLAALFSKNRDAGTFGSSNKIIDFCFFTSDFVTPLNYRVFTEKVNGLSPSDHNAVLVDVSLD